MVAVFDQRGGEERDLRLGVDVCLVPDGIGHVRLCAVAENGAAVGLCGVALFFQLIQVAADGLLRDVIVCGKIADKHALLGAQLVENFVFPLNGQHDVFPQLSRIPLFMGM